MGGGTSRKALEAGKPQFIIQTGTRSERHFALGEMNTGMVPGRQDMHGHATYSAREPGDTFQAGGGPCRGLRRGLTCSDLCLATITPGPAWTAVHRGRNEDHESREDVIGEMRERDGTGSLQGGLFPDFGSPEPEA